MASVFASAEVIIAAAFLGFSVISAGVLRIACSAKVPTGWLVLIVVYGLGGFASVLLSKVVDMPSLPFGSEDEGGEGGGGGGLIEVLVQVAGVGLFVHIPIMIWFSVLRSRQTDEQRKTLRESFVLPSAGADEEETEFVIVSAKTTFCQTIFLLTIGGIFALISFVIWIISMLGPDFSPLFFPLPFLDFYKAKLMSSSFRIKKRRVFLNAGYADAYFLFVKEKMWNLVTFGFYKRCYGDTYVKWLDAHLEWAGGPPEGFNSYFTVFFNKGTLWQRVYYYVMSTILFSLFGWIPFFRPIYLRWHFQQVISRLVLGGRVPELDKEYTIGAFFKVYFLSCCGLLAGKINVFVDSHITFDMSKTLKGPDAGELEELESLREHAESEAQGVTASVAPAPAMAAASIGFDQGGVPSIVMMPNGADSGEAVAVTAATDASAAAADGTTSDRNLADAQVVIEVAEQEAPAFCGVCGARLESGSNGSCTGCGHKALEQATPMGGGAGGGGGQLSTHEDKLSSHQEREEEDDLELPTTMPESPAATKGVTVAREGGASVETVTLAPDKSAAGPAAAPAPAPATATASSPEAAEPLSGLGLPLAIPAIELPSWLGGPSSPGESALQVPEIPGLPSWLGGPSEPPSAPASK